MRTAAKRAAFSVYFDVAKIRFAMNLGKAAFGNYRGAISNIALNIIARSAGAKELGEIVGGEVGSWIAHAAGEDPCR
jgi:hypothetical protein